MHLIFSKVHLTISCHTDLPSTSQSILDVTAGNERALAKQRDNLAKPCTKVLYTLLHHLSGPTETRTGCIGDDIVQY